MRKSRDLLGLPVMDVSAGKVVGRVRQIIFLPDEKRIAGFIVGGGFVRDKTAISFERVLSLGNDAVTIADAGAVRKLNHLPELQKLLSSTIEIYNAGILTVSGRHLGNVEELLIADDGRITHLVVSEGIWRDLVRGVRTLSTRYVRAIGEDAIIVDDAAEVVTVEEVTKSGKKKRLVAIGSGESGKPKGDTVLKHLRAHRHWFVGREKPAKPSNADAKEPARTELRPVDTAQGEGASLAAGVPEDENASEFQAQRGENHTAQHEAAELERLWMGTVHRAQNISELVGRKVIYLRVGNEESDQEGKADSSAKDTTRLSFLWESWQEKLELIRQGIDARSAEYLIGKRVERGVSDDAGNPIISAGETVTEEVVEAARRCGRLYHLALSCAIKEVDEKMTAIRSRLVSKPPEER